MTSQMQLPLQVIRDIAVLRVRRRARRGKDHHHADSDQRSDREKYRVGRSTHLVLHAGARASSTRVRRVPSRSYAPAVSRKLATAALNVRLALRQKRTCRTRRTRGKATPRRPAAPIGAPSHRFFHRNSLERCRAAGGADLVGRLTNGNQRLCAVANFAPSVGKSMPFGRPPAIKMTGRSNDRSAAITAAGFVAFESST